MSELDEIYGHLNELRTRVLRVVIVVGVIAVFLMTFHLETVTYNEIVLYYPTPEPLNNIAAQLTNYFEINLVPEGVQLIQTAPGQSPTMSEFSGGISNSDEIFSKGSGEGLCIPVS